MHISRAPYWFKPEGIKKIEEMRSATHMGYWCTKRPNGGWNDSPVDVFYVENPDISKGHTNYFGMFVRDGQVYITNAATAFEDPITGALKGDEVVVSRYRHDFRDVAGGFIDGGRDYLRVGGSPQLVKVLVAGPEFHFELTEWKLPSEAIQRI